MRRIAAVFRDEVGITGHQRFSARQGKTHGVEIGRLLKVGLAKAGYFRETDAGQIERALRFDGSEICARFLFLRLSFLLRRDVTR